MWWLIPIGIGVGLKLIYDAVTEDEREARYSWEEKRVQVENSIESHRRNIEEHLSHAQYCYDFYVLVDLHYSSMQVADTAYRLLDEAKKSFSGMTKMIEKAKEQRTVLETELNQLRSTKPKDANAIKASVNQLKLINQMKRSIYDDRDKVKAQREALLTEVQQLNNRTRELKLYIKERCGCKGEDWYYRLEERKRIKRKSEGNW